MFSVVPENSNLLLKIFFLYSGLTHEYGDTVEHMNPLSGFTCKIPFNITSVEPDTYVL